MAVSTLVPIDQRFAQLIRQFGLTKNSFAISLGKTASVVQHLIDGRNKPGYDLLCKVFEIYPNVSRDWLLLGRGPMLVSGEHAPKPAVFAPSAVAEPPFEPIDLTDVEAPAPRRARPGNAGTRLQPVEIADTLALAAAVNLPARATVPVQPDAVEIPRITEMPVAPVASVTTEAPAAAAVPFQAAPAPVPAPALAELLSAPAVPLAPVAQSAPAASGLSPEVYMTAAWHAQHLQHQLVLAEMRNQHLLEQQQLLREMLAMARQSMV